MTVYVDNAKPYAHMWADERSEMDHMVECLGVARYPMIRVKSRALKPRSIVFDHALLIPERKARALNLGAQLIKGLLPELLLDRKAYQGALA